jgi:hypothetical protein
MPGKRKGGVTLDEVAAVALGLPETAEVLAWEGERTWRVRDKIFVMGAPGHPHITVKTSKEEQAELTAADPDTFAFAPYVGRFGWTQVRLSSVDPGELAELIVEAWRRTAPKKLVAEYDSAEG